MTISHETRKAIARRLIDEVYSGGNLSLIAALVAPEYVAYDAASPTPAYGPAGARELADRYRRAFPDLRFTVEDQNVEGDTVITRWRSWCTNAGKAMGISAGPAELTTTGTRISRFAGDRIVEERVQWDTLDLLVQGGAASAVERSVAAQSRATVRDQALPTPAALAATGAVLARAFADDPLYSYAIPDPERRRRILPVYFSAGACYGSLYGALDLAPGAPDGAAVWVAPEGAEMTTERLTAAGFPAALALFEVEERARLAYAGAHLAGLRRQAVPGPHWYLMLIGVEPAYQGRGVGARLLREGLMRADQARLPCYLETTQPRNVAFYERHGFTVVSTGELPEGGFSYWTMYRLSE